MDEDVYREYIDREWKMDEYGGDCYGEEDRKVDRWYRKVMNDARDYWVHRWGASQPSPRHKAQRCRP